MINCGKLRKMRNCGKLRKIADLNSPPLVWVKAVLKGGGGEKIFVTPTETNVHRDALCFTVMGPSLLQRLAVGGWQLAAVGGWRLVAVGSWHLVILGAVLKGCPEQKKVWVLKDSPGLGWAWRTFCASCREGGLGGWVELGLGSRQRPVPRPVRLLTAPKPPPRGW